MLKMGDLLVMAGGRNSEEKSSPRGNACRLDPAHLPSQQNANEEDNGQANTKRQCCGHVAFFGRLALGGWRGTTHHVHQGRDQTDQNGKKCDGDKNFHERIIQ